MWLLLAIACTTPEAPDAPPDLSGLTPPVSETESDPEPVSYSGPSYTPCVTDASCEPGEACTTVDGYDASYCAPPCDPAGAGDECAPDGAVDYDTWCLPQGRCARSCDGGCPDDMACVSDDTGLPGEVCAGEPSGTSGYYGLCSHPNVDGTDCPDGSACYGGEYVNSDWGVCLPYCPDSSCPDSAEDGVTGTPICYDVGLELPVCALVCIPSVSTCPSDQVCYELYSNLGICAPADAYYED